MSTRYTVGILVLCLWLGLSAAPTWADSTEIDDTKKTKKKEEKKKELNEKEKWEQRMKFIMNSIREKVKERGVLRLLKDYRDGIRWRLKKSIEERNQKNRNKKTPKKNGEKSTSPPSSKSKSTSKDPFALKTNQYGWYTSLKTAKKVAAKERKLLVLKVGATWWLACQRLEAVLHSNDKVKKALDNYIVAKLDIEDAEVKTLDVKTMPVLLFYTPDGKLVHRHLGYKKGGAIVRLLEKVEKKYGPKKKKKK